MDRSRFREKSKRRSTRKFSYKNIESLKILDKIDAGAPNWNLRDYWIKKNKIVFNDMTEVLKLTKENKISLAVLKPTEF